MLLKGERKGRVGDTVCERKREEERGRKRESVCVCVLKREEGRGKR